MARRRRGSPGQMAMPVVPVQGRGAPLQPLVPGPVGQGAQIANTSRAGGGGGGGGMALMRQAAGQKHEEKMQAQSQKNQLERDEIRTEQEERIMDYASTITEASKARDRVWEGRLTQVDQASAMITPLIAQGLADPTMMAEWNTMQRELLLEPIRMEHIVDGDAILAAIETANTPEGLSKRADLDKFIAGYDRPVMDELAVSSVSNMMLMVADRTRDTVGHAVLKERLGGVLAKMEIELTEYTGKTVTGVVQMLGFSGKLDYDNPLDVYTDVSKGWIVPYKGAEVWTEQRKRELDSMGFLGGEPRKVNLQEMFDAITPQGSPLNSFLNDILAEGGRIQVEGPGQKQLAPGAMGPPDPGYGAQRTSADEIIHRIPPELAYGGALALPAYSQIATEMAASSADHPTLQAEWLGFAKVMTDLGGILATSHRGLGVPPRKAAILKRVRELRNASYAGEKYEDLKGDEAALIRELQEFEDEVDRTPSWDDIIASFESTGPFSLASRFDHPVWGTGIKPTRAQISEKLQTGKILSPHAKGAMGTVDPSTIVYDAEGNPLTEQEIEDLMRSAGGGS